MAVYGGVLVLLKTNSGVVPAITTAHYTGASAAVAVAADVAAGSADFADLLILGESSTRYYKVARFTGSVSFANESLVTAFQWFIAG